MKFFILFCLFIGTLLAETSKEVLILHSYHKGYKWSDDISLAIEKRFKKSPHIELTTIYMDTKRVAGPIYLDKLASLYQEQFSTRNFDLVIASDNNAFEFVIRYHEKLFQNLPVLFCGINNFDKALLDENSMKNFMSGVVEHVDLEKNFELISKLHPNLKNLIILNDRSKTGYALKRDLRPIIKKYSNKFNIEYIDNMDINNLETKISNAKKDTVILFVLLFKDKTGKHFTYKQSFQKIKEVSKIPIYGLWDFYLDFGIVGGLLTSAHAQGEAVSQMALKVLQGKKVTSIPILERSPNRYIFDYNELNRFNIEVDNLVNEYEVINLPTSIYQKHSNFFIVSTLVILILTIVVIIMKGNIQRRKKVEKELLNQIKFEKVLLDTLPNAIYYKNKDGKFIGCNEAFCQLVQMQKNDVIGKTAFDFFPSEIAKRNTKIDAQILKNSSHNTSEIALNLPNTHMKYFILNKAVYSNIDGSIGGIVCIMDDISERVQQKQFLIQQSKLAEMGDMIAAIAHQWNEPLVELSAQVQDIQTAAMLNELQEVNIEEFVNDSMVQIKYMSQTLSDFRNFLKPSTTKTLFSIKKSFDGIFEIIGKQIFYCNIQLHINYEKENEDFLIYGFENEFKQVLLNLINNAKNKIIQCNEHKSHETTIGNITINIYQSSQFNKIEIIDDAGKIDEDIIGLIFNPYFTTKKEGTGLGLYMAKVIIEDKMQGLISVQNRQDNVVFTIKLPHKKEKVAS